jgi:hypothetical protein
MIADYRRRLRRFSAPLSRHPLFALPIISFICFR